MEGASDGQQEDRPLSRTSLWKHTVYPFSEIKQARPFQVTAQDIQQTELEKYSDSFPESPCWESETLAEPPDPRPVSSAAHLPASVLGRRVCQPAC